MPVTQGTTVTYNGVVLQQVRITDYRVVNSASQENPNSSVLHHTISGEAIVYEYAVPGQPTGQMSSNDAFRRSIHGRLNTNGGKGNLANTATGLRIEIVDSIGSFTMFDNIDPNTVFRCEMGGPFFRSSISQITGTNALLVNFTAEWSQTYDVNGDPLNFNNVRAFTYTATFNIDETGRTTLTKQGSIMLRRQNDYVPQVMTYPPAPNGSAPNYSTDNTVIRKDIIPEFLTTAGNTYQMPDQLRRWVAGNLPRGFRRVKQEFVCDESRSRMLFNIVDEEYFRGLPAPAKVGNCQYTFERGIEDGNAIGVKHFIASVKGDSNVTPGALLNLCIRLSQNRINYKTDLITKIRVTEENMLSENAITYEVMAKATSIQNYDASGGEEGETSATPVPIPDQKSLFLRNILSAIQLANGAYFEFVEAQAPDAYGYCRLYRITPGQFNAQYVNADAAGFTGSTIRLRDSEVESAVYLFPDSTFDAFEGQAQDSRFRYLGTTIDQTKAGPNKDDLKRGSNPNLNPTYNPSSTQKRSVITGLVDCPAVCFQSASKVFQVHTPVVIIEETVEGSRPNEAPNRMYNDMPSRSMVSREGFAITGGRPDLNGNNVMSAQYSRQMILRAPDDLSSGPSLTDPSFQVNPRTINGETVILCEYFPDKLERPAIPDELAGDPDYDKPQYTAGLGTFEGYAT